MNCDFMVHISLSLVMWDWKLGEISGFNFMATEGLEEYVIVKQSEYILSEWRVYGCRYLIASKRGAVKLLFT